MRGFGNRSQRRSAQHVLMRAEIKQISKIRSSAAKLTNLWKMSGAWQTSFEIRCQFLFIETLIRTNLNRICMRIHMINLQSMILLQDFLRNRAFVDLIGSIVDSRGAFVAKPKSDRRF